MDDSDTAVIEEVRLTLEKLSKHYSKEAEVGGFADDWKDEKDRLMIANLFDKMASHYRNIKGVQEFPDFKKTAEIDLWFIYSSLADIFKKPLDDISVSQSEDKEDGEEDEDDEYVDPQDEADGIIDELVSDLMEWDMKTEGYNHFELQEIFVNLSDYYDIERAIALPDEEAMQVFDQKLPIKIGELKEAFGRLAYRDGSSNGSPFDRRGVDEDATLNDYSNLLDKLVIHYSRVSDGLQPDIDAEEAKTLAHIFDRLQFHYMMNPL